MQEIRFRHSEEQVIEYLKQLRKHEYLSYDSCSTCGQNGRGCYQIVTGNFVCINCLAKKRFEELVGKPLDI